MGCGDKKLLKYLTQTFTAHCNALICQQVTLSGDAEWPKVADAVIEADSCMTSLQQCLSMRIGKKRGLLYRAFREDGDRRHLAPECLDDHACGLNPHRWHEDRDINASG